MFVPRLSFPLTFPFFGCFRLLSLAPLYRDSVSKTQILSYDMNQLSIRTARSSVWRRCPDPFFPHIVKPAFLPPLFPTPLLRVQRPLPSHRGGSTTGSLIVLFCFFFVPGIFSSPLLSPFSGSSWFLIPLLARDPLLSPPFSGDFSLVKMGSLTGCLFPIAFLGLRSFSGALSLWFFLPFPWRRGCPPLRESALKALTPGIPSL